MNYLVCFIDLDRCLIERDTDAIEKATPAFEQLQAGHVPLILVSGRTRAEIEPLRQRLRHHDPFIVENGAAIFVPSETFGFPLERSRRRSPYQVIELGTPYAMLRDVLKQVEETVNTPLLGFGDLSLDEIMRATGLSPDEALRAKLREYDEPFLMEAPASLVKEVRRQIAKRGLVCTRGERFYHLTGANDTKRAAEILVRCYRRKWQEAGEQEPVLTVAVGETFTTLPLLSHVDHAILVQKPDGSYDAQVDRPGLIRAPGIAAGGWNHAVLDLLKLAA